jgi:glycosyltransferase involved in cell wall biosynthesis
LALLLNLVLIRWAQMKLSIIIPAYNEVATINKILEKIFNQNLTNLEKEIIVVDDGSTDGTTEKIKKWAGEKKIKAIFLDKNHGKGYAVRQGIKKATGDYVLIQDADLEYNPADIPSLLKPIFDYQAEVVYGSRFTGPHRNLFFWHWVGNRLLTLGVNVLFNTTLSDMEVGYKLIKKDLLNKLPLREDRFGIEPEITAKILKRGVKIYEVPISYYGRDYSEGKKITWRDGIEAVVKILKYRLVD